ncbi:MAG: asparagine synthase (glutamine-hydrolyzing) [Deltaproteobacteria bacterium]|nr:asparagine synthase (glutamine-hydrolyzing) [Deltaproteobacteria bacterium]
MCGIAGVLRLDGVNIDERWLRVMTAKMVHRGPDHEGIWSEGPLGFGHRRLSIIDLQTGNQPISNEDGSVWVVFNGEIYNFRELRNDLELRGHIFKTTSDTEVLVHGYEEWGKGMMRRLNGMFAFALWHSREKKLLLVRDRLGVKPLYYHLGRNVLIFASELRAVMASLLLSKDINLEALEHYMHYQYIPSPLTIYRDVHKLNPSEWLELDLLENKNDRGIYWDIDLNREPDESKGVGEWVELFGALIEDAVKIRLYSDVPFGAFLSGGTDSGLTVAMMSKNLNQPVHTFSIGLEGEEEDELPDAAQVAQKFNTVHEAFRVAPEGLEIIPEICSHFGEPFADSSALPTYYVSKMASSKVKMVLSGDGGDEVFGGYLTYHALLKGKKFSPLQGGLLKKIARWMPSRRLKWGLDFAGSSWEEQHDMLMRHFSLEERRELLGNGQTYSDAGTLQRLHPSSFQDRILKAQYVDLKTYLPDDVLTKVDRMSMANSLEVRSPLLDYRIAETAFSMPTSFKIPKPSKHGITGKFILKELASNFLGREYVYRPKKGFGIPIDRWLREDRKGYIGETLLSSSSPIYDYVDRSVVTAIAQEHRSGHFNHCAKLWNLLMLDGWLRYVHKKTSSALE